MKGYNLKEWKKIFVRSDFLFLDVKLAFEINEIECIEVPMNRSPGCHQSYIISLHKYLES